jgi:predicted alpha-1,2-mannosidase
VEGWDACGGYHYSDASILGFSHTHLSGTGVPDYGDVLVMPMAGAVRWTPGDPQSAGSGYRSRFRHEAERAWPGYYAVRLDDGDIGVELTATTRVGLHRYTFARGGEAHILVDLLHGLGPDRVIDAAVAVSGPTEISGYRRSRGWARNQIIYFTAQFSRPFASSAVALDDAPQAGSTQGNGTNVKWAGDYAVQAGETILVKVALSTVSVDGARNNLAKELPGWDFDATRKRAEQAWAKELGKIEVQGASERQQRVFATALYHAMIAPNVESDVDGRYLGMDGTVRESKDAVIYTVFSLWDTFRALHPLLSIIDRARTRDFVRSLLAKYGESGVLPVWEFASNETWCMIGYHAVPVIVDAWMKGIRDFDGARAFEAMKHSAMMDHFGLAAYRAHGFIPGDRETESVSRTLEYAYDDWCIARMARELGRTDDERVFLRRAASYRNLLDPSTGFMRARMNGCWARPFDPAAVTNHYTEANAWQYSFFAPQDIPGLIALMGGRVRFALKLDSLFESSSITTGREQSDISGMIGQYAQGNEPSHHVAHLFTYAGQPWKTQRYVRLIMDSLYTDEPDGLCGNDDCGQMSAWYVLNALGMYQVTPGHAVYALSTPVFPRAVIRLENGNAFTITTDDPSGTRPYLQASTLNKRTYNRYYLQHDDIMRGGTLACALGAAPKTAPPGMFDIPPAADTPPVPRVPLICADADFFPKFLPVSVEGLDQGKTVVAVDEQGRAGAFRANDRPITLTGSAVVRARTVSTAGDSSDVAEARFTLHQRIGTVTMRSACAPEYDGGGPDALVDGRRGEEDHRVGGWMGFEGGDCDAVIDLGAEREITRVALGCLQNQYHWIFFPVRVAFAFSTDGKEWSGEVTVENPVSPKEEGALLREFSAPVAGVEARYVRVHGEGIHVCPDWHKGAGRKGWLFADEALVEWKK